MNTIKTIVVDDHADFRRLAQVLLADLEGVELIALGEDGEEAVRLCESHRPDLLLCDITMPRMGGIQATRLIKAQDDPPYVAVVSIYDDAKHRQHAKQAGADCFINKVDFLGAVSDLVSDFQEKARV